ncbi:DUF6768 family protein [Altererythrobacter lutimaris]|nr:DUF6768 family protein [Altererythrobacter lutimaris]
MTTKTTDELDQMIDAALDAEERELLSQIGEEPGYFSQVWGLFGGQLGWVTWLLMIIQTVMFIASVYAAIQFFNATDTLVALHWGLPAVALLLMSAMTKFLLWPSMQTNRVLRELKRVELQIARANHRG